MAECAPEEELKCSICLEIYTNPKLLKCFHVYCQSCLQKIVSKEEPENPTIACPVCKQVTPVPEEGVEGLFGAFHIKSKLKALRQKEGGGDGEDSDDSTNYCTDHAEEETKLYCQTCEELICSKCVILGGKHHRHSYDSLGVAFEKYKEEIGAAMKPMEEKLASVRKALEDLDRNSSSIADQEVTVQSTISDAIQQIHALLDSRQAELLDQLQQVTDHKMRELEAQRSKLMNTRTQLTGAMDFVRESNATGQRLMMRTTTSLHPDDLKPSVEADMRFDASPEVFEACQNFGELSTGDSSKSKNIDGRNAKAIRDHMACKLHVHTCSGGLIEGDLNLTSCCN